MLHFNYTSSGFSFFFFRGRGEGRVRTKWTFYCWGELVNNHINMGRCGDCIFSYTWGYLFSFDAGI